ncbi:MAG: oligosaccharide flippase family protein [candidate division WOR-3 bacterium]
MLIPFRKDLPISDVSKKLISGSSYSYLALLANKLLSTASSIYLARKLGPENLGIVSVINYMIMLMLFLVSLGIPQALIKLSSEYEVKEGKNKRNEFVILVFFTELTATLFFCIIYFICSEVIASKIYQRPILTDFLKISSLAVFFYSLASIVNTIFCAILEFKLNSLSQSFTYFIGFILLVPMTHLFGVKGAVISGVLASFSALMFALAIFLKIKKKHSFHFIKNFYNLQTITNSLKMLFNNSLPLFLSGLFTAPALPMLTAFLTRCCGLKVVGYFNVAYSLGQFVLFIPQAIGTPFVPLMARLAVSDNYKSKRFLMKTMFSTSFLVFLISFTLAFLGPAIVKILYGKEYLSSEGLLVLFLACSFLASPLYIYGFYLIALGKMWVAFLFNLFWFVVLSSTSYITIKKIGFWGSGIGFLVAYVCFLVAALYFIYKEFHQKTFLLANYIMSGLILILLLLLRLVFINRGFITLLVLLLILCCLYVLSFIKQLYKIYQL